MADKPNRPKKITPAAHHSYLLRVWSDSPRAQLQASLEDATSGEEIVFADLDALFTFLYQATGHTPPPRSHDD